MPMYLVKRGFENPPEIVLPVYGLYDGYANIVRLTYRFLDGSSKRTVTSVTTATFDDQAAAITIRRSFNPGRIALDLSYDYIFNRSCGHF